MVAMRQHRTRWNSTPMSWHHPNPSSEEEGLPLFVTPDLSRDDEEDVEAHTAPLPHTSFPRSLE